MATIQPSLPNGHHLTQPTPWPSSNIVNPWPLSKLTNRCKDISTWSDGHSVNFNLREVPLIEQPQVQVLASYTPRSARPYWRYHRVPARYKLCSHTRRYNTPNSRAVKVFTATRKRLATLR
ncbi:hypothetical protein RRG08_000726 [Elysia crispata]|uniref:Uncharacterized protein n=1 Tax=Elysia crispata TaxID=231223 RepID=A0AAE1AFP4_9GAST|nr:hypothetical protein RRG08_000726 [Elysia crispata]